MLVDLHHKIVNFRSGIRRMMKGGMNENLFNIFGFSRNLHTKGRLWLVKSYDCVTSFNLKLFIRIFSISKIVFLNNDVI